MTEGIIEGLTGSLGDELSRLGGLRSTRLTAQLAVPNVVTDHGTDNATANDASAAIYLTRTVPSNAWQTDGAAQIIRFKAGHGIVVGQQITFKTTTSAGNITSAATVTYTTGTSITVASSTALAIVREAGLVIVAGTNGTSVFAATLGGTPRFRCLSPLLHPPSVSTPVTARVSDTEITLTAGAFTTNGRTKLRNASWEIYDVDVGVASLVVETTHGWDTSGQFAMAGGLYRYTGTTATVLQNIEYFNDEVWTYQLPKGVVFPVGEEVVDLSRAFSAVDTMWRSFLPEYAAGEDLDAIGRNLGVRRPPDQSDAIFRAVIKAIAYVPRGTMWVIELLLDAVLGAGQYEIFEDLTQRGNVPLPSVPNVPDPHFSTKANHTGQVFIQAAGDTSRSAGKTFIEATETGRLLAPVTSATLAHTPIKVLGVQLAREGSGRMVATGGGASVTSYTTTGGVGWINIISLTIALPVSSLPVGTPLKGDSFYITHSGGLFGRVGTIESFTLGGGSAADQVVLKAFDGATDLALRRVFGGLPWKITREKTAPRHGYLPSADKQIEYATPSSPAATPPAAPTPGPLRQMWTYASRGDAPPAAEGTPQAVIVGASAGQSAYLQLRSANATNHDSLYQQQARILPESEATFEVHAAVAGDLSSTSTDAQQVQIAMEDGVKRFTVGFLRDSVTPGTTAAPNVYVGFLGSAGAIMGGLVRVPTGEFRTYLIEKDATGAKLYVNGLLVDQQAYASFPAVGLVAGYPAQPLREFGVVKSGMPGGQDVSHTNEVVMKVEHLDWSASTPKDFTNVHDASGTITSATKRLTDNDSSSAFFGAVVGDLVRITQKSAINASTGGDARGLWAISATVDANNAEIAHGPTHTDGEILPAAPLAPAQLRSVDDPRAFTFPTDLGNDIEFLSGPNAGVPCTIVKLLDPITKRDLRTIADVPYTGTTSHAFSSGQAARTSTSLVELDVALTPDSRASWRKSFAAMPSPSDANVKFEVAARSSLATKSVSLLQDFPIGVYGPYATATFTASYLPDADNGPTIKLINTDTTSVVFTMDSSVVPGSGTGTVIGTSGIGSTKEAIYALHTAFAAAITAGTLKMSLTPASYNPASSTENYITLKQNVAGLAGNTLITVPENVYAQGQGSAVSAPRGAVDVMFSGGTASSTSDGPLVETRYTQVLSAQTLDGTTAVNVTNVSPGYAYYPFYLHDDFSWARGILDVLTAAGVHVDLRSFTRDLTGPHIR